MKKTRAIEPPILYYGTPVALIATLNHDGTPNLAPMSSNWALHKTIVLGLGLAGQTIANLRERPELTINFPDASLWENVECLAPLTGVTPVPEGKRALNFRYEAKKFEAAGLTPVASEVIAAPRVIECPIQFEARVAEIHISSGENSFAIVEANVLRIHAHESLVLHEHYIDIEQWYPLVYLFRHYFGRGEHLGKTFRATQ